MEPISEQIIQEIKHRRLSPRPKWQFYLLNGLWWLSAGLTVIFGAVALALVLNSLTTNDWSWADYQGGWLSLALSALPLVWLISALVLFFVSDYTLVHTKKAYRWKKSSVFLIILGVIFVMAIGLERLGLAEELDEFLQPNMPAFMRPPMDRDGFWHRPEVGLVTGVIVGQTDDNLILVKDLRGQLWNVDLSYIDFPLNFPDSLGRKVKIFGTGTVDNFQAQQIRFCAPLKPGCQLERKVFIMRITERRAPRIIIN